MKTNPSESKEENSDVDVDSGKHIQGTQHLIDGHLIEMLDLKDKLCP